MNENDLKQRTIVSKTYALSEKDERKLISYTLRYRTISTTIDEVHQIMRVATCFADNKLPTSAAAIFNLEIVSELPSHLNEEK